MATNSKKKASAVAAVAVAAAMALGGTFAWQGYQSALNEASDVVNPGGRLHDDFNGSNKDVYVENFADDDIFARVRLSEYFEIVMNQDTPAERVEVITGERVEDGATGEVARSYDTHFFGQDNNTDPWWTWATGGETTYMPTFNKNKDSLVADVNGTYGYVDPDTGESDPYGDYIDYSLPANATMPGVEIYDADANDADEVGEDLENAASYPDNVVTVQLDDEGNSITHSVQQTGSGVLISMDEWFDLYYEGEDTYGYWVYDADGWVYWSSPIEGSSATGLLLDGIEPAQVMDDSWYYAINVEAQFVTADDLGSPETGDGFYANGEQPTEAALELLGIIGVDVDGESGDNESLGFVEENDTPYLLKIDNGDGGDGELNTNSDLYDQLQWGQNRRILVAFGDHSGVYKNGYTIELLGAVESTDMGDDEGRELFVDSQQTSASTEFKTDEDGSYWFNVAKDEEVYGFLFKVTLEDGATFTDVLDIDYGSIWAESTIWDEQNRSYLVAGESDKIELTKFYNFEGDAIDVLYPEADPNGEISGVPLSLVDISTDDPAIEVNLEGDDWFTVTHTCDPEDCPHYGDHAEVLITLKDSRHVSSSVSYMLYANQPSLNVWAGSDELVVGQGLELHCDEDWQLDEVIWKLEEAVDGVQLEGSNLTATAVAAGKTVTVIASDPSGVYADGQLTVAIVLEPAFTLSASYESGEGVERLLGDERMVITVVDAEGNEIPANALNWEIVGGGVYSSGDGEFTHYSQGTDEWNSCPCTTKIKVTLISDPMQYGVISVECE